MLKPALLIPLLTSAALGLTACATTQSAPPQSMRATTTLDTWANRIEVQSEADEIRLASHATGLSGNQARALADLHVRWMQAEGSVITIAAPRGSGQEAGSYRVSADAKAFLTGLGVSSEQVHLVGYDAGGAPQAPVIVGYERYFAMTPNCGGWSAATATFTDDQNTNFGCAVAANIATQVANPEDLLRSRAMQPADPARRSVVLDKYRRGDPTGSTRDAQSSGTISQAIQ